MADQNYELATRFRGDATSWKVNWTTVANLRSGAQAAAKKARNVAGEVAFVKILNKQSDPERRIRMYQEIVSIQRLNTTGVPKLVETNAHHYADPEYRLYVAMEFIDGTTVTDLVPRNRIPSESAVRITLDLCKILRRAHEAGVCHRDIKPDNVMLVEDETAARTYLVDFGIAHLGQSDSEFRTETEQTVGNAFLVLPELRGGFSDKGDPRSDITLCVGLLFYILTKANPTVLMDSLGRLPHQRPVEKATLAALDLPAERLRQLFDRGFRNNISDRFQTLDELEDVLKRLLQPGQRSGVNVGVSLDLIRERLDGAGEEEKRRRVETLNAALTDASSVLDGIVSSLQGRVVRTRSNFSVTASYGTMTDGFQLSTDSRRTFAATFEAAMVGDEVLLRVKGPGVPRITLRAPFLTTFDAADRDRLKQFMLNGLDLMTRDDAESALTSDIAARSMFAAKMAEEMTDAMVEAVTAYIEGSGRDSMVMDTAARSARAQMFTTSALAQAVILARLVGYGKYARFNCLARVEIPNHREETETQADQQIMITLTDERTGTGPSSSIESPRYAFTPLRPSHRQIHETVKTAIAEIAGSLQAESIASESLYDRIARESREAVDEQAVSSQEQAEQLGNSIVSVSHKLRSEICAGMRSTLGEPEMHPITGIGVSREFFVRAESSQERARATITAKLTGQGPEHESEDKARYKLELSIYVKPGPGRPTGSVQTIRVKDDYYGPGRPGISADGIQTAILNELARVERMGK